MEQHDRLYNVIGNRFYEFGFTPVSIDFDIVPSDGTTLFICSGMQKLKQRFRDRDGSKYGSRQSCIRTNDIDLVGDGTHLTYFEMIGNFSFGGNDYESSVEMWHLILSDLSIPDLTIHVHPTRADHRKLWEDRGYVVVADPECEWSDGEIGGNCCEVYCGGLEIGNLVNPLGHSTDVGFGMERLLQVLEGKARVDETSIYDQRLPPVVRDHVRAIEAMIFNNINPGNKGREYVCRRLVRRVLRYVAPRDADKFLHDVLESERAMLAKRHVEAKKAWRRNKDRPPEWWWETHGILPEEITLIKD